MTARQESEALHRRVRSFIETSLTEHPSESFEALACDLARFQAARVPSVGTAFRARDIDPATVSDPNEIPALPTDVFRLRRVAVHPPDDDVRVFATSGTTDTQRGRHPFRELATYQRGAMAWAERMLFPNGERLRLVLLACDETRAPESSLTYMLARFADHHRNGAWFWDGERLDTEGVVAALSAHSDLPVLVAGTSFAFVHLCDSLTQPLPLPRGSRVMQTGGFKGRSREVAASELKTTIASTFRIDEASVVAEYGMTELSSQLYQSLGAGDARYHAPPWLRVEAASPLTLEPLPRGEEGLARFVDLANVDSSVAIQTADRVIVDETGAVTLLGRMPGAPPRGCSLALEHLLASDG